MRTIYLGAVAFVPLAYTQNSATENTSTDILSCSNLSCVDSSTAGVCETNTIRATGVGIAAEVLNVGAATNLSLTLVDSPVDGFVSGGITPNTEPALYIGVPPGYAVQDQPPACALMMQYESQTFPELTPNYSPNTTSCENIWPSGCRDNIASLIREFEYSPSNSSTGIDLNCCEALAQYVMTNIRPNLNTCGWISGKLNITGGAILGPDATSETTQLQTQGCQPTSPENYQLHQVATMYQVFRPGIDPDFDAQDSTEQVRVGSSRSGITPVLSIFYGEDDNAATADVQWTCLKTFAASGAEMPDELNFPTSGATAVNKAGLGVAGTVTGVVALLIQFLL